MAAWNGSLKKIIVPLKIPVGVSYYSEDPAEYKLFERLIGIYCKDIKSLVNVASNTDLFSQRCLGSGSSKIVKC